MRTALAAKQSHTIFGIASGTKVPSQSMSQYKKKPRVLFLTRGLRKLVYFMRFYPRSLRLSLTSGHKMSMKSTVIGAVFWIIYILMPFLILFLESFYKLWLVINICELKFDAKLCYYKTNNFFCECQVITKIIITIPNFCLLYLQNSTKNYGKSFTNNTTNQIWD